MNSPVLTNYAIKEVGNLLSKISLRDQNTLINAENAQVLKESDEWSKLKSSKSDLSVEEKSFECYLKIRKIVDNLPLDSDAPHCYNHLIIEAVKSDHCLLVSILANRGANIHQVNSHNNRGLLHHCRSGRMVELLLSYGADIHQKSTDGHTALHSVSSISAASALIENGLSIETKNNAGGTVLHCSMDLNLVSFFLKHGARPNSTNNYGHSPMHLIATQGHWEIIYILLMAGCDVSIVGRDGMSAVSLARAVKTFVMAKPQEESHVNSSKDLRRMEQTIELLARWQAHVQRGCKHPEICRLVSSEFSWKTLAVVCKKPRESLTQAWRLPDELVAVIVEEYLGPFRKVDCSRTAKNKLEQSLGQEEESGLGSMLRKEQYMPRRQFKRFADMSWIRSTLLIALLVVAPALGAFYMVCRAIRFPAACVA